MVSLFNFKKLTKLKKLSWTYMFINMIIHYKGQLNSNGQTEQLQLKRQCGLAMLRHHSSEAWLGNKAKSAQSNVYSITHFDFNTLWYSLISHRVVIAYHNDFPPSLSPYVITLWFRTPPHTAIFTAPIKIGVFAHLCPIHPHLLPLGVGARHLVVVVGAHRVDHRLGVIVLITVHVLVVLVPWPVQTLVVGFITLVTFVVGALKLIKRLVWRC